MISTRTCFRRAEIFLKIITYSQLKVKIKHRKNKQKYNKKVNYNHTKPRMTLSQNHAKKTPITLHNYAWFQVDF